MTSAKHPNWDKRDVEVCGPGDNRSRAHARKEAKTAGNRRSRRISRKPDVER